MGELLLHVAPIIDLGPNNKVLDGRASDEIGGGTTTLIFFYKKYGFRVQPQAFM